MRLPPNSMWTPRGTNAALSSRITRPLGQTGTRPCQVFREATVRASIDQHIKLAGSNAGSGFAPVARGVDGWDVPLSRIGAARQGGAETSVPGSSDRQFSGRSGSTNAVGNPMNERLPTANSGHSTVLAERPWLGRVPAASAALPQPPDGELLFRGVRSPPARRRRAASGRNLSDRMAR